ncbi:MAG TPA: hypothetical protein VFM93_12955 [Candidatus Limnocylindria bacterium]|nr:hypothetical protein [Candidatus Limnocylindria bacterium]
MEDDSGLVRFVCTKREHTAHGIERADFLRHAGELAYCRDPLAPGDHEWTPVGGVTNGDVLAQRDHLLARR